MATVRKNKKFSSVEIVFKKKPNEARRKLLHDNKYVWSPQCKLWYKSSIKIKDINKEMVLANKLVNKKL